MDASELIQAKSIVPVVVIQDAGSALDLAMLLADAGFNAIEVTLRTPAALEAIELIATKVPGITVGAGSVRNPDQFARISDCGARFAVSPGASDRLVAAAQAIGMPFVPGAATASEMIALLEQGYRLQKFFPAELSGGLAKIKALSAPLPEVRFFPTGGIDADSAGDYLASECVHCIGGSWFVPGDLVEQQRFSELASLASDALQIQPHWPATHYRFTMAESYRLIADIGGTNARFALVESSTEGYSNESVLRCCDFISPEQAITHYLDAIGVTQLQAICFAVAGPVTDGSVELTNNNWHILSQ
jgi:2-dehydro-3-deoxyphosphogluconate aldolase/(4S)-4-hydroxy-2-oxoglutarate aldolase